MRGFFTFIFILFLASGSAPKNFARAAAPFTCSEDGLLQELEKSVMTAKWPCPASLSEWSEWRKKVLTEPSDPDALFRYTNSVLSACEKDPEQEVIFKNKEFLSCMQRLKDAGEVYQKFDYTNGFLGKVPVEEAPLDANRISVVAFPKELSALDLVTIATSMPTTNTSKDKAIVGNIFKKLPSVWQSFSFYSTFSNRLTAISIKERPDGIQILHIDSKNTGEAIGLTILTKDKEGKELIPPELYPVNYTAKNNKIESTLVQIGRCTTCHTAGIMPGTTSQEYSTVSYSSQHPSSEILNWLNHTLGPQFSNATPKHQHAGQLKLPQLGEIDPPTRTDTFMKNCIQESGASIKENRIRTVQNAMNCAACHDGKEVDGVGKTMYIGDPLTSDFGRSMNTIILGGTMPPPEDPKQEHHNSLTRDERIALQHCLQSEYYAGFTSAAINGNPLGPPPPKMQGTLIRSLLETSCPYL